jgi:hypothetical protein
VGCLMDKGITGNPLAVCILSYSLDDCPGPLGGLKVLLGTLYSMKVDIAAPQCR